MGTKKIRHFTVQQVKKYVEETYSNPYYPDGVQIVRVSLLSLLDELTPTCWPTFWLVEYKYRADAFATHLTAVIAECQNDYGEKDWYLIPAKKTRLSLDLTADATIKDEDEEALRSEEENRQIWHEHSQKKEAE